MSTPARIAAAGTILINALSFLLSFTALTDIARRAHVTVPMAWPLIVDGLIVVATVAVVALRGSRYAWSLLMSGAAVSVAGNVLHACYPEGPIPVKVAAFLAVVPPVALVAVTHLTVHLARHSASDDAVDEVAAEPVVETEKVALVPIAQVWTPEPAAAIAPAAPAPVISSAPAAPVPVPATVAAAEPKPVDQRATAERLIRETSLSNYAIADRVGVSEATIRRWRKAT